MYEPQGFSKANGHPTPEMKKHRPSASGERFHCVADVLKSSGLRCVERWEGKHKVWFFPDQMLLVDAKNVVRHLRRSDTAPTDEFRWWYRESKTAYYPVASYTAKALEEMLQATMEDIILGEK